MSVDGPASVCEALEGVEDLVGRSLPIFSEETLAVEGPVKNSHIIARFVADNRRSFPVPDQLTYLCRKRAFRHAVDRL